MARLLLLAALCGLCSARPAQADDPPKLRAGEARLADGRLVEYALHYDRNSLRDSLRLGDRLIAATSSGTLLRFDLPTVRLIRERIDVEITCLGLGQGAGAIAGLADGRICR